MSLTVDQKQELVRWLESAEWWKELPYPALEAKLEAVERLEKASIEFYCGMIDKAAWREAVRQSPKGQELIALAAQEEYAV